MGPFRRHRRAGLGRYLRKDDAFITVVIEGALQVVRTLCWVSAGEYFMAVILATAIGVWSS